MLRAAATPRVALPMRASEGGRARLSVRARPGVLPPPALRPTSPAHTPCPPPRAAGAGAGAGGDDAAPAPTPASWAVTYLYDGDCPACRTLKNVLARQDGGAGRVRFVNIADPAYDENDNWGVLYEEAMDTIHVYTPEGKITTGPEALRLLYSTVGLGWAATVAKLPIVSTIVDWLYELISKYRLGVGGVDAIIALKRVAQVDAGDDQCDKTGDEGCDAPEW